MIPEEKGEEKKKLPRRQNFLTIGTKLGASGTAQERKG